jgi:hypothetical protein
VIKLEVLRENPAHFVIRADEPVRIEISEYKNHKMVYVYRGVEDNQDQEPVGGYDTAICNSSWQEG